MESTLRLTRGELAALRGEVLAALPWRPQLVTVPEVSHGVAVQTPFWRVGGAGWPVELSVHRLEGGRLLVSDEGDGGLWLPSGTAREDRWAAVARAAAGWGVRSNYDHLFAVVPDDWPLDEALTRVAAASWSLAPQLPEDAAPGKDLPR